MAAQYQVVSRTFRRQFAVHVVAHVREQHQHVAAILQPRVLGGSTLRIGKDEALETLVLTCRMVVVVIVGHHAHEPHLDAAAAEYPVRRGLGEGDRIAHHIGTHHVEAAERVDVTQKRLTVIELVVSERSHVVAHGVHHVDHGTARLARHVDVYVARPAVARIGHDRGHRVAAVGYGRSQTGKVLDLGVDVGRGDYNDAALGYITHPSHICRGRYDGRNDQTECFFHIKVFSAAKVKNKILIFTHILISDCHAEHCGSDMS